MTVSANLDRARHEDANALSAGRSDSKDEQANSAPAPSLDQQRFELERFTKVTLEEKTLELERFTKITLEELKLDFERHKAGLDFRKFVLGSVIVAIAIAAIPPTFQLASAVLERAKSDAEREKQERAFRDTYVKDFVKTALEQDIENRIRLEQYFSKVSTPSFQQGWADYLSELTRRRDKIQEDIEKAEVDLFQKSLDRAKYAAEIESLQRKLQRMYHEIGNSGVSAIPADLPTK